LFQSFKRYRRIVCSCFSSKKWYLVQRTWHLQSLTGWYMRVWSMGQLLLFFMGLLLVVLLENLYAMRV
jgi:hypothetical protein